MNSAAKGDGIAMAGSLNQANNKRLEAQGQDCAWAG